MSTPPEVITDTLVAPTRVSRKIPTLTVFTLHPEPRTVNLELDVDSIPVTRTRSGNRRASRAHWRPVATVPSGYAGLKAARFHLCTLA
jgi:hypothetical protein